MQYLTGRFIGGYYSGSDLVYRHEIPHLGGSFTTRVDIVDTSQSLDSNVSAHSIFLRLFFFLNDVICKHKKKQSFLLQVTSSSSSQSEDCVEVEDVLRRRPSSAYLIVYSLTDDKSFRTAVRLLEQLPTNAPKFLVANKLDLEHRRQVSRQQGQRAAYHFASSLFGEFSAADNSSSSLVKSTFRKLIRQAIRASYVLPSPQFPSLTKLFGSLRIRKRSNTNSSSSSVEALIRGRRGGSSSSSSTKSSNSSVSSFRSTSSLTSSSRFRTTSSSSSSDETDTQNVFQI